MIVFMVGRTTMQFVFAVLPPVTQAAVSRFSRSKISLASAKQMEKSRQDVQYDAPCILSTVLGVLRSMEACCRIDGGIVLGQVDSQAKALLLDDLPRTFSAEGQ